MRNKHPARWKSNALYTFRVDLAFCKPHRSAMSDKFLIYYILGCNTGGRFGFLTEPYVLILKKVEVL